MGWFSDGVDWFNKNIQGLSNVGWKAVMDLVGLDQADANRAQSMLSDVPVIGDVLQWQQKNEQMQDYLDNRGLDWSDMKYPALQGLGAGRMVRSVNSFVSKNIDSLYKD